RHEVDVRRPHLLRSQAAADLEPLVERPGSGSPGQPAREPSGRADCLRHHTEPTAWVPGTPDPTPEHRRDAAFAVRLGLDSVRGIGSEIAQRIVAAREQRPFADVADLSRRAGLDTRHLEALATAGALDDAFAGRELSRRQALWESGWTETEGHLEGVRVTGA